MKNRVSFFSNTPDDTHCYQAAIRMVAKYLWPAEEYSWDELDKMTAKVSGLWTWATAGLLWLQSKGAKVKVIEIFDYQKFIESGDQYLLNFYGDEVGNEQIKNSDIAQEQRLIKEAIQKINIEKRLPTTNDIIQLLDQGYLVICNINSNALNEKSGFVGHFVVIIGYEGDHLVLHDPGLPPQENRVVSNEDFSNAWAYPNSSVKNLIAIKGG